MRDSHGPARTRRSGMPAFRSLSETLPGRIVVVSWLAASSLSMLTATEAPVGLWLAEQRTDEGIGKALEFSQDGRIRLSQGLAIGDRWVVQAQKKDRYTLLILDPATEDPVRTVQLKVETRGGHHLVETDLHSGDVLKMTFISKGRQRSEPPFLGRWQFMLERFGIPAVYEYTEDGWVWLRAPIHAEMGTYRIEDEVIVTEWPGAYAPILEVRRAGPTLVTLAPDGSRERYLPPQLLETMTPRRRDPRR